MSVAAIRDRTLLAAGAVAIVLLFAGASEALFERPVGMLANARERRAAVEALAAAPPVGDARIVAADDAFIAPDGAAAAGAAVLAVRTAAGRSGVLIEQFARERSADAELLRLRIVASGSESGLIDLARRIEAVRPAIRLTSWTLERAPSGGPVLRLEAGMLAGWRER